MFSVLFPYNCNLRNAPSYSSDVLSFIFQRKNIIFLKNKNPLMLHLKINVNISKQKIK